MTTRSKKICAFVFAAVLSVSMFPAYAFAFVVSSAPGPVSEVVVAGNNYAAYTDLQVHSDLYMNGYSNIIGGVTTPAGGYKATSYLYWVGDAQDPWLVASSSSSNAQSVTAGTMWANQVWAKMTAIAMYRCQSAHWVNYSGGSHGFGTQTEMQWNPGWPLPFSEDLDSSMGNLATSIATNDSGLTYGTSQNLDNPEGQPDLIGVVATNGELGYVYYDDLYAVTVGDLPSMSSEEAVSRSEERNARMAVAFKEVAAEFYGVEVLTEQDALDGLTLLETSSDLDEVTLFVNDKVQENIASSTERSASEATVEVDELLTMLDAVKAQTGTNLPVYAQDGLTQIGEFVVSAL